MFLSTKTKYKQVKLVQIYETLFSRQQTLFLNREKEYIYDVFETRGWFIMVENFKANMHFRFST